jgi:hypothetical protein
VLIGAQSITFLKHRQNILQRIKEALNKDKAFEKADEKANKKKFFSNSE